MFLALLVATLVAGLVASTAFAGKGGGGKPGGGGTTTGGTSTLELKVLTGTDSVPNWSEQVAFNVSTTATTEPHVSLQCKQSGTLVYTTQTGYYASYPWPWTQTMTLSSGAWTSGAADCTAVLYYFSGTKTVNLKTLTFTAYA